MNQTNIIIFEDQGTLYTHLVLWRECWFGLVTAYDIYDNDRIVEHNWCWSSKFWPTIKEKFSRRQYNVISRDYKRAEKFFPNVASGSEWFLMLEPPCVRKYPREEGENWCHFKCDSDYRPHPNRVWDFPEGTQTKLTVIRQQLIDVLGNSRISSNELLDRFLKGDSKTRNAATIAEYQASRARREIQAMIKDGTLCSKEGNVFNDTEVWVT